MSQATIQTLDRLTPRLTLRISCCSVAVSPGTKKLKAAGRIPAITLMISNEALSCAGPDIALRYLSHSNHLLTESEALFWEFQTSSKKAHSKDQYFIELRIGAIVCRNNSSAHKDCLVWNRPLDMITIRHVQQYGSALHEDCTIWISHFVNAMICEVGRSA